MPRGSRAQHVRSVLAASLVNVNALTTPPCCTTRPEQLQAELDEGYRIEKFRNDIESQEALVRWRRREAGLPAGRTCCRWQLAVCISQTRRRGRCAARLLLPPAACATAPQSHTLHCTNQRPLPGLCHG